MHFYKYQGTGNDFVMIDDRSEVFDTTAVERIKWLCDRRFGIGADGLILLRRHHTADFQMVYFNSDGNPSTMCGNGGRCIAHFARHLGVIGNSGCFLAADGFHNVHLTEDTVALQMKDVNGIEENDGFLFIDTGSPHVVVVEEALDTMDLCSRAREIRYNERFRAAGTNVNFIRNVNGTIHIRTYERGVEDETLSCGTGMTAAAIAASHLYNLDEATCLAGIPLKAPGGNTSVRFRKTTQNGYSEVFLTGPAVMVFEGDITLP